MSATFGSPLQTVFSIGYDFHVGNGTSGSDNGNVWGITNSKDTTRNQTFTYDALNRLISAQNAGTDCSVTVLGGKKKFWGNSYGYDAWGNLLSKTVTKCSAEALSVVAGNNNRLTGAYLHDAAGNMTHDATSGLNYTFDQENRLTGAAGYTYTYDGDGNRVRKSNGNLAANGTLYWEMTPGVVAETDLAGAIKSEYIFFDGERVARRDGPTGSGGVFYYFSDHLKTASVITDSAGVIKAESDYYPWGGELQFVNNDSNDYKFTGKKRDVETGLDYFGARYYSNGLGRWVSADWSAKPVAVPYADFHDPQSLNLYGFVGGNPASKADSDGHCVGDECSGITVTIKKTDAPAFRTNEKQSDRTYETGVRGQATITLTKNGKAMVGVPVKEKIVQSTTVDGKKVQDKSKTARDPVPTNSAGQIADDVGRQLRTLTPASDALAAGVKNDLTTKATTVQQQQTLTFPGGNGATCSATDQRTLTNVDKSGNLNTKTDSTGSNYTLTIKPENPKVKEQK